MIYEGEQEENETVDTYVADDTGSLDRVFKGSHARPGTIGAVSDVWSEWKVLVHISLCNRIHGSDGKDISSVFTMPACPEGTRND
ncbi:hypothetical protein Baya_13805 [Bagarius yarrelli]|uniref:Uncharacterized protein n=1 Tax=Bagarius yarrelli TaxID=175774 RepID=A0A556V6Y9_BAGYA|nr:hypothetical protein Baya_13805 [Bagarius yarrelli]